MRFTDVREAPPKLIIRTPIGQADAVTLGAQAGLAEAGEEGPGEGCQDDHGAPQQGGADIA